MSFQPGRRALLAAFAGLLPFGTAVGARERLRVVGYLSGGEGVEHLTKALAPLGYVEGINLRWEIRKARSLVSLPESAAELVAQKPEVLVAEGPAVVALAAATRTIPIVCGGVPDPVGAGLAQSVRRPGGNVTGLTTGSPETAGIVFGLLKTLRPGLRRIAVLHSPGAPVATQMRAHGQAAATAGIEWRLAQVSSPAEVELALAPLAGEAVWMAPLGGGLWREILAIARRHRIATLGGYPGCLMWYGRDFTDAPHRVAAILDLILKGAHPAEIPFELPDRQYFVVNRATARAIGVEIPAEVLLRATEVVD